MTVKSHFKWVSQDLLRMCLLVSCCKLLLTSCYRRLFDLWAFKWICLSFFRHDMSWNRLSLSLHFFKFSIKWFLFLGILLNDISKGLNTICESPCHSVLECLELLIRGQSDTVFGFNLSLLRRIIKVAIELTNLKVLSLNLSLDLLLSGHNIINKSISKLLRATRNSLRLTHLCLNILHPLLDVFFAVYLVLNTIYLHLNFPHPVIHCFLKIFFTRRITQGFLFGFNLKSILGWRFAWRGFSDWWFFRLLAQLLHLFL